MKKYTVIVVKDDPKKVLKALKRENMEVSFKDVKSDKKDRPKIKKASPAC